MNTYTCEFTTCIRDDDRTHMNGYRGSYHFGPIKLPFIPIPGMTLNLDAEGRDGITARVKDVEYWQCEDLFTCICEELEVDGVVWRTVEDAREFLEREGWEKE